MKLKEQILNAIDRRLERRIEQRLSQLSVKKETSKLEAVLLRGITSMLGEHTIARPFAQNPWVYACVRAIAQAGAHIPFKLWDGDKEIEDTKGKYGHVYKLFRDVNPYFSRFQLWEAHYTFLELSGECIWVLSFQKDRVPERGEFPREIWIYPPGRFQPSIDKSTGMIKGWKYVHGTQKISFSNEEIIHFRQFSPYNDIRGQASTKAAMQTLATEWAAKLYEEALFKNGAMMSGFLKTTEPLSPEEKKAIMTTMEARHVGEHKAFRIGLLEGGMDYVPAGQSLKDMMASDLHKMGREETCAVFGVPTWMVGGGDIKYANAQEQRKSFMMYKILPGSRYSEDVLRTNLFERFDLPIKGRFDEATIPELQEDQKAKWQRAFLAVDRRLPWTVVNETFGLNIPDIDKIPGADVPYGPMATVPIDSVGGESAGDASSRDQEVGEGLTALNRMTDLVKALPSAPKPITKEARISRLHKRHDNYLAKLSPTIIKLGSALHRWVYEFRQQILGNFFKDGPELIQKVAKLEGKTPLPVEIMNAIEELMPNMEAEIIKIMDMARPHLEKAMEIGGQAFFMDAALKGADFGKYAVNYEEALSILLGKTMEMSHVVEGSYGRVRAILTDDFLAGKHTDDIAQDLRGFFTSEAGHVKTVARTEIIGIANEGKYSAMKKVGLKKHQWVHASIGGEPRPEHETADGVIVNMDEFFPTAGGSPKNPMHDLLHPHDWDNGTAADNANCHCGTVMPEYDEEGREYDVDELL